jgi:hypothetical protein
MEGLWLVQEDGGEGERVLLDALVGWEQRGEAAAPFFLLLAKLLLTFLLSSPSKH